MKNLALLVLLFLFSCKKNHDTVDNQSYSYNKSYQLPDVPEALQKNDSIATGIYKGVTINTLDSAATFKFNIANSDNRVYGLLYSNNIITDSLVRYVDFSNPENPPTVDTSTINAKSGFGGTLYSYNANRDPSVYFVANSQGSAVTTTQLYSNFTVSAVMKEQSNSQVFCFEGSYNGADNGKIAFLVSANEVTNIGSSHKTNTHFSNETTVGVSAGKFVLNGQIANLGFVVFTGTYNKTTLSGTWTVTNNPSAANSFFCKRTL